MHQYPGFRENLIRLMPYLAELHVYDNSAEAEMRKGDDPVPKLILHLEGGKILGPRDLRQTPDWAKPIVAMAMKMTGK